MTITLEPELEEALDREAQRQGTSPEDLAVQELRRRYLPPAEHFDNAYDFLKDCVGVLDSREIVPGGARMSERTGQKFTEILVQKRNDERKRDEEQRRDGAQA